MRKNNKQRKTLSWNLPRRIIWLDGEITQQVSDLFQQLLVNLNRDSQEDIVFFIRSCGGGFFYCLDMINAISRSKSQITLVAFGLIGSSALLLTQARYKKRLTVAGSKFCFHQPHHGFTTTVKRNDFFMDHNFYEQQLREIAMINATQVRLLSQHGAPAKTIWTMLEQQCRISTRTAQQLHLVDQVISKRTFRSFKRLKKRL